MSNSNLVNASIIAYISFTFLFFVVKFRFFPKNNIFWILAFLAISCIVQTIQNISLTASPSMCGKPDIKMALYSTVVPWVLVFALFIVAITAIPGWVRVFSNTFGVYAAEAYGLKETLNMIMKKPDQPGTDPAYLQMLENIYSDRMALVLELNIDDVKDGEVFDFPSLNKLVELKIIQGKLGQDGKPIYDAAVIPLYKDLYNALLLKENVGYFFWFLLIGIFCILVSTNSLLASTCTPSVMANYGKIFK